MSVALDIEGLRVTYEGDVVGALRVSLRVATGEVFALIGETGSGKSTVALAVARLLPASARIEGRVTIDGLEVSGMSRGDFRGVRGAKVGFIPQDAMAALNPLLPVGRQVAEVFEIHQGLGRTAAGRRAVDELRRVWIHDPESVAALYPHQLSGGMRQRIMIAIALALRPPLLIADEATTALDVSTQAEILRLVDHLRHELDMGVLWITHDLGIVAELADRVAVMYGGRILQESAATAMFDDPPHPYAAGLLNTLRSLRSGQSGESLYQIAGQPPASATAVAGCPFHPRCERAIATCDTEEPALTETDGMFVACHNPIVRKPVLA
jgi:oligopeptide/dipeptide ABC transporter ATP-binding protein